MAQERAPRKAGRHILEYLVLLVVLAGAILAVVHPWAAHFTTGLPHHWDPPPDATHICWNAHNVLHGSVLRPVYDANHFYPHAYSVAFAEPMWPPSFFTAIIYGLWGNPMLAWNATALFVWALSGVTMFAFLRELSVSRGVAYLGAAIFCLMPYRLAYYVELNMMLCFVIPLVYLFLLRWLRRLGWVDALLLALVMWLSATSCLYYTVILSVPVPFIVAGFLVRRPEMLRQRRFYLTAALAVGLAGLMCAATLYPYVVLRWKGGYVRTVQQQARSSIQPLTFLRPSKASLVHRFSAKANMGETVVFPGITLLLLAGLYWVRHRVAFRGWHDRPRLAKVRQGLACARALFWFLFVVLVLYGAYHTHTSSFASVKWLVVPSIDLVFLVSAVLLFLPTKRDVTEPRAFLAGLGVGAVACLILSFGPAITLGHGRDIVVVGKGAAAALYGIIPTLSMIRVMTRFVVIVLLFMIAGGCVALDALLKKAPRRLRWLWVAPLLLLVAEAFLHSGDAYPFTKHAAAYNSPVQQHLRDLPQTVSIAQIPYGLRDFDGPAMMRAVGRWHYLINGWCGFMPKDHYRLGGYLSSDQMREAADWLREIWPDAYLLVDLQGVYWWQENMTTTFTEDDLAPFWNELMRDRRFALYELKPLDETPPQVTRRLRTDVLRRHPRLVFDARAIEIPDGATAQVTVRLNGSSVATIPLTSESLHHNIELPREKVGNIYGEEVSVTLELAYPDRTEQPQAAGLWELRGLDFTAN